MVTKRTITETTTTTTTTMYCNNNSNGKYWVTSGPELSRAPEIKIAGSGLW